MARIVEGLVPFPAIHQWEGLVRTPAIHPHCPELIHLEDLTVQANAILNIDCPSTENESNHDRDDCHYGGYHDEQYDSNHPVKDAFSYSSIETGP